MCAFYQPPTEITPEFNSLYFQGPNNDSLTTAEADERYLARQNIATSVASATSFTGGLTAPSVASVNSGSGGFSLSNSAANTGAMVIQNSQTNTNLFYRQSGTTRAHIFQTDGSTITNLTLSSVANTSNLPLSMSSQAINDVPTINSTNSGGLGISIQNSILNGGGVALRNFNTASDMVLNCAGPTRSIFFQIAGVPQVSVTSTTTSFAGDIIPRTTWTAKTGTMLGFNGTLYATNTGALTSGAIFNNVAAGFFLNIGVYFFSILVYLEKTVSGGDITKIETGISLLNNSFSGGFIATVAGHQTYSSSSTDAIVHNVTFTLPVQINTTLYFLTRATHTLSNLNNTVNSYIQYTKVA